MLGKVEHCAQLLAALPHVTCVAFKHLNVTLIACVEQHGIICLLTMLVTDWMPLHPSVLVSPGEVVNRLLEPFGFVVDFGGGQAFLRGVQPDWWSCGPVDLTDEGAPSGRSHGGEASCLARVTLLRLSKHSRQMDAASTSRARDHAQRPPSARAKKCKWAHSLKRARVRTRREHSRIAIPEFYRFCFVSVHLHWLVITTSCCDDYQTSPIKS